MLPRLTSLLLLVSVLSLAHGQDAPIKREIRSFGALKTWRVGDYGPCHFDLPIIQVLPPNRVLVADEPGTAPIVMVEVPTVAGLVDGGYLSVTLHDRVWVTGTYTYKTVLGAPRTVLKVVLEKETDAARKARVAEEEKQAKANRERADREAAERQKQRAEGLERIAREAAERALWRTWSVGGRRTVYAKFIRYENEPGENPKVYLEIRGGGKHVIHWPAMSKADQEWVRKKVGR